MPLKDIGGYYWRAEMQNSEFRMQNSGCRHAGAYGHSTLGADDDRRENTHQCVGLSDELAHSRWITKFELSVNAQPVQSFARLAKRDLDVPQKFALGRSRLGLFQICADRGAHPQQLVN